MFGQRISHAVLLGTTPPGEVVKVSEQLFYETAPRPVYTLEDYTTLFFEPKDEHSRAASERSYARIFERTHERSPEVPAQWAAEQLLKAPRDPLFPSQDMLNFLKHTSVPILHLGADHDIIFPVENWYALSGALPTLHLVTYPRAGHAPHHQHPEMAAAHISAFTTGC